jgi:hypothetical protein
MRRRDFMEIILLEISAMHIRNVGTSNLMPPDVARLP